MMLTALLSRLGRRACSATSYARVIDPLLADMAYDLQRQTGWRRAAVLLQWTIAYLRSLLRVAVSDWAAAENGAGMRTLLTAVAGWACMAPLIIGAMLAQSWYQSPERFARFDAADWIRATWLLWPQGVIVCVPLALVVAAIVGRHGRQPTARRTIALLTAAGTVAMLGALGYVPAANRAFRALVFAGDVPLPGANELDLPTLVRALTSSSWLSRRPEWIVSSFRLSLHLRVAFAASPIIFGWLAVTLSRSRTPRIARAVGATLTLACLWWYTGPDFPAMVATNRVSPLVVAWTPNVTALVVTAALFRRSMNRAAARTAA